VTAVLLAGAAVVGHSVYTFFLDPPGSRWVVIAFLTILTGSFSVKVASINARISVSETFVFVAALLFGTAAGTLTVLVEALIVLFWMSPAGRPLHRLLFNLAAPAVAISISASVFFLFPGVQNLSEQSVPLSNLLVPLTTFTTLYFLLNSWLVAVAVGLETQQSPASIWSSRFKWLSVNYYSGASVAALIVTYMPDLTFTALLFIVPLLVGPYLAFQTAMGRVEDSNKHLSELNQLYLSTIETLAMAIDAKDQITHGHIRRVQGYAMGLARSVGITDEKLLKAIEAAALLHDMGKLAVPEYILNKPGKLTSAEFEKMKLHASVGADILSAIDFPYPVVPIVRHHHENWDGTGYPQGLKGTDIPIGARILAVVDCFDALTSDRPYRPRLSDVDALKILFDRRGSMYDPLVVDSFMRVHLQIAPKAPGVHLPSHALHEITSSTQTRETSHPPGIDDITAGADEMLTLYGLAHAVAGRGGITETCDVIANQLRRLVPFTVSITFVYDEASNELEVQHATSTTTPLGLRIPVGQRLSGWVAAHRQTVRNSDPVLDLGEIARKATPRLRSCLSTPLTVQDRLLGVLSLYSTVEDNFTEDHQRILEIVARLVAPLFRIDAETSHNRRPAITQIH
jgi:putative nucleotidyltransferase with HDIG domain